jgi:hypothetical protein
MEAHEKLEVVGRAQRGRFIRIPQLLFGLMIELLVPAIRLSCLLPKFVSAMDDLFFGGFFHIVSLLLPPDALELLFRRRFFSGP